jgi:Tfp pilus assembly protein FimT
MLNKQEPNMQATEVARLIISGVYTNDELNNIADAIKFARSQIVRRNTGSFVVGSRVQFTNSKTGAKFTGRVNKVKQKFILVATDQGPLYNVPANMLELA